jgi:spore coat protein H
MANPAHEKLVEMLDAVNDYTRDFNEVFDKYFDEENYLTWLATSFLIAHADGQVHNFMLYSPSISSKWYILPWDYDETLEYYEIETYADGYYQLFGVATYWPITLHQRYFRIQGNIDKLTAKVQEIFEKYLTEENVEYHSRRCLEIAEAYLKIDFEWEMLKKQHADSPRRMVELLGGTTADEAFFFRIKDENERRYQGIINNYQRYMSNIESPTAYYLSPPTRTEDGWAFVWDPAYDFQRDRVTYEILIASDPEFKNLLYHNDRLTENYYEVPSLPNGDIFLRIVSRDEHGNLQYPLDIYRQVTYDDGVEETSYYRATLGFVIEN